MRILAAALLCLSVSGCDDGCDLCPVDVKPDAAASVSGCGL